MGISGLSSELVGASLPFQLSELRNQTACVDGHGWLHKGAIGCARALAEGEPTQSYAHFVVRRIELLARFGVRCIVVFDGPGSMPAKSATVERRAVKRAEALRAARQCGEREQQHDSERLYAATVQVTGDMVRETVALVETTARGSSDATVRAARAMVAPYEADPQLAALCLSGEAQAVISEDSDMFAYLSLCGLRRTPLVMRLDANGDGMSLFLEPELWPRGGGRLRGALRCLLGLHDDSFGRFVVQACVACGCDYAPDGIRGVGPVTAAETVFKLRAVRDHEARLARLAVTLRAPTDFIHLARRAEAAFYHARVWGGTTSSPRRCLPLAELLADGPRRNCPNPPLDPALLVGPPLDYDRLNPAPAPPPSSPRQRRGGEDERTVLVDDPDSVCPEVLRSLPTPIRAEVERQQQNHQQRHTRLRKRHRPDNNNDATLLDRTQNSHRRLDSSDQIVVTTCSTSALLEKRPRPNTRQRSTPPPPHRHSHRTRAAENPGSHAQPRITPAVLSHFFRRRRRRDSSQSPH